MRDIIDMSSSITCEVGKEKEIDGIIYVGVSKNQEVMGIKGRTILDNAKSQ